jgi:predicted RND superfamily exporter protein
VAAGLLLVVSMSFATVLSYADMAANNIGINVNTVPIIAIGIGIGIDYAIYVIDRIREDMAKNRNVGKAVQHALSTTGLAVCFTAATLIAGVVMWVYFSDLRFQSDAAKLLIVMVLLNAVAALALIPAWIVALKPKFIKKYEEDEVILETAV